MEEIKEEDGKVIYVTDGEVFDMSDGESDRDFPFRYSSQLIRISNTGENRRNDDGFI